VNWDIIVWPLLCLCCFLAGRKYPNARLRNRYYVEGYLAALNAVKPIVEDKYREFVFRLGADQIDAASR
jgi:hypothetical protein